MTGATSTAFLSQAAGSSTSGVLLDRANRIPRACSIISRTSTTAAQEKDPVHSPKALELIAGGDLRADILIITDGAFGEPPKDFQDPIAEVKQQRPLRLVAVLVGSEDEQAHALTDKVITVADLFDERERLRDAVAEIV